MARKTCMGNTAGAVRVRSVMRSVSAISLDKQSTGISMERFLTSRKGGKAYAENSGEKSFSSAVAANTGGFCGGDRARHAAVLPRWLGASSSVYQHRNGRGRRGAMWLLVVLV